MRKHHRLILSALIVCLIFTADMQAQSRRPERIRFERGRTSAVVKGRIVGFDYRDYILGARGGQTMTAHLASSSPYVNFVILKADGTNVTQVELNDWSGQLDADGDYTIRVLMPRAGARRKGAATNYTLEVSIR
jgi:hypothetical protein